MKIPFILLLTLLYLAGAPFANEAKQRSLFTDVKAHKVGDLITVLIVEDSRAANKAKTSTQKKTDASTSGTAGIGPLDFIPDMDHRNRHFGPDQPRLFHLALTIELDFVFA